MAVRFFDTVSATNTPMNDIPGYVLADAKNFVNRHQGNQPPRSGIDTGGLRFDLVQTTILGKDVNALYCHAIGLLVYPDGVDHPFPGQSRPDLVSE